MFLERGILELVYSKRVDWCRYSKLLIKYLYDLSITILHEISTHLLQQFFLSKAYASFPRVVQIFLFQIPRVSTLLPSLGHHID